jgi:arylsulfatase A-like enzyme
MKSAPVPTHLGNVWLVVALCLVPLACKQVAQSPPDVILITLDTTRRDHLGVYGYARPVSPEIDRFAHDAVVYKRAWSASPWTLPSHASMITGLYPTSHGAHMDEQSGEPMFGNRVSLLGPDATTLAEILQARGYATAAFAGGPWLSPEFGLLQGYQVQHAGLPDGTDLRQHTPNPKNVFEMPVNRSADELTDAALAWMRSLPARRPLHMLINYFDPHWPYQVHPGFDMRRNPQRPANDPSAEPDLYDGEIAFMDHHLGRLLDGLRAAGRYDRAVIIVVADHGESFGEHGLVRHGPWLYEELIHVPLLIHFPAGRDGGTSVQTEVSTVDLLPLISREVGFPVPPHVEGVPIGARQLLLAECFRSAVFIKGFGKRFDRDLVAAVRWPWKLIVPDTGVPELYKLDDDPQELHDRAGDPAEPELRAALDGARKALVRRVNPGPRATIKPQTLDQLKALGYVQ